MPYNKFSFKKKKSINFFREEIDRLTQSLIKIRQEIQKIMDGKLPQNDKPLINAPHSLKKVTSSEWNHCYSREEAAYPLEFVEKRGKYWPVGRADETYGDRNFCAT